MDLFLTNKNFNKQCQIIKNDILKYYNSNEKIKILSGNEENIGKSILIVTNKSDGYFNSNSDNTIKNICDKYNIKYFLTYNYFFNNISMRNIKEFSPFIHRITDIVQPKLILCLGELSQLCYFKKKFMIENYHGQEIGKYQDIPIYTSYEMEFYDIRSKYTDTNYKNFIKENDWNNINLKYKELL